MKIVVTVYPNQEDIKTVTTAAKLTEMDCEDFISEDRGRCFIVRGTITLEGLETVLAAMD
jgi:hypothetical protein